MGADVVHGDGSLPPGESLGATELAPSSHLYSQCVEMILNGTKRESATNAESMENCRHEFEAFQ